MFISLDELKKHAPNAVSMEDYIASPKEDEPRIVLRDYEEPT